MSPLRGLVASRTLARHGSRGGVEGEGRPCRGLGGRREDVGTDDVPSGRDRGTVAIGRGTERTNHPTAGCCAGTVTGASDPFRVGRVYAR